MTDSGETQLQEINVHDCLELLGTMQVGRIGVVSEGRPEIFPVNYTLDASDSIVFRTAFGTKLPAAINHDVVFEVDWFDEEMHTGWSVVVHGVAHQTQTVLGGQRPLNTWRDNAPYMLRISHQSVTGRRI